MHESNEVSRHRFEVDVLLNLKKIFQVGDSFRNTWRFEVKPGWLCDRTEGEFQIFYLSFECQVFFEENKFFCFYTEEIEQQMLISYDDLDADKITWPSMHELSHAMMSTTNNIALQLLACKEVT